MIRTLRGALLACATFTVLPALAGASTLVETFSFDAKTLRVVNLIGEITVEGHSGSTFEVEVTVNGESDAPERIRFDANRGAEASLVVQFPVNEEQDYTYPRLNSGSRSSFTWGKHENDDSTWKRIWNEMQGKKITVSGDNRGLELYADVVVKVPEGGTLFVRHGVGDVTAGNATANLDLDSHTGTISAENIDGNLRADTGSGSVKADGIRGKVDVDTGSGKVTVTSVTGDVNVDTGSGTVTLSACRGEVLSVDTGSGKVTVTDSACRTLSVDTGSGSVKAPNMEADNVSIDTGSGSVEVTLAKMGVGAIDIDTGSGGIELNLPSDASVSVDAETGSGRITLTVDGEDLTPKKRRSELSFTIGDGESRVTLETGSGSIHVTS